MEKETLSHAHLLETTSLGECWLQVSKRIMEQGQLSRYDGVTTREIAHLTMVVAAPDPHDPLIGQYGDPAWLAWMHENFFVQKEVAELGHAASYAIRLFNYANQGRDQIQWIVERLGKLIIHVKSAHIYAPEWEYMGRLCEAVGVEALLPVTS